MKALDDLLAEGVAGRRVLVRADLNVPLDGGSITDDGRIRAVLPTLRRLVEANAQVVVCSHLGRPQGAPDPKFSLAPVAARLGQLLDAKVRFAQDTVGDSARQSTAELGDGELALLENLRFDPRETSKDHAERRALAAELASFADAYVDDAFGALHRKHASVFELPRLLPHYAGGLVLRELEVLGALTGSPNRPYAVVLGGAKVSDKLAVIDNLLPRVDTLLIGGGMCFTLLAAAGHAVGDSLLEADQVDTCKRLLDQAGGKIVLPADIVVAREVAEDAETRTVPADQIPDEWKGLDIGPRSAEQFATALATAKTVFWNGPMGVFEVTPFASGTRAVA
ncbi:MAG: phosphoglycerate kinase, partial [Micromonosporaceae bacterium]